MTVPRHYRRTLLFPVLTWWALACARVPKEVVELSYRMGGDISAIHVSYKSLVRDHFDGLRAQRLRYLDDEWAPHFIAGWVADGRLVDVAKGVVVWSEEKQDFVAPTPDRAQADLLKTVRFWAQAAMDQLEKKKRALLQPLDSVERALAGSVDEAFNQLYRGNAAITAHLNSLRKVQEVQDAALQALHVKDLRDKINQTLEDASNLAQKGLDQIRKLDSLPAVANALKKKIN